MKILLPVDGSDYTKRMLAYLAAHDELLGAGHDYLLFNAVPAIPAYAANFLDSNILAGYYEDAADEVFKPLRAFAAKQGWKVRERYDRGPAADAIADVVKAEQPDLIVMGTHGHSALGNVMLGSVASGVLARCQVPVLLVR